jgi:selenide,water dikinase
VSACTDVTGFGFAGHLLEMLDASGVSAHVKTDQVPLYPGFLRYSDPERGEPILSTLHDANAHAAARVVSGNGHLPAWLFDPQTSGGLLAGVAADKVDPTLGALREAGCVHSAHVGEVVERSERSELTILV